MNPKIPTSANVADLLALAEVLQVPDKVKRLLADIAQQLADARTNFKAANDKAAEAMAALVQVAVEKADLIAREQTLAQKAAVVAESHALVTKRETAISMRESDFDKTAAITHARVEELSVEAAKAQQDADKRMKIAEMTNDQALATMRDYETRLQKLRALAG